MAVSTHDLPSASAISDRRLPAYFFMVDFSSPRTKMPSGVASSPRFS